MRTWREFSQSFRESRGLFLTATMGKKKERNILTFRSGIDTPGITCRDIALLHEVSKTLFKSPNQKVCTGLRMAKEAPDGNERMKFRLPGKLLYPRDYWDPWMSNAQSHTLERFVQELEKFLGVERTTINLADKWIHDNPEDSNRMPIEEYLNDVRVYSLLFPLVLIWIIEANKDTRHS